MTIFDHMAIQRIANRRTVRRIVRAAATAAAVAALGGCAATRRSSMDGSTDRAGVEQAMARYATALRTAAPPDSVAAMFTVDGEMLQPGMMALHGRAAIRDFLAPLVGIAEVESVEMTTSLLEAHGEWADQWGGYRQRAGERGKAKQEYRGRFAALWHREPDGAWRLARLMMQPLPTPDR